MGRLTNEARREKARESLVKTIAKINDLEPTLGGKWKASMVNHYIHVLAELVLYQSGFDFPSSYAVGEVASGIRDALDDQMEVGS